MPYDAHRLYQIQRTKSSAEIRHADEQAARIASALAVLFGVIIRRRRIAADGGPARWRVVPEQDCRSVGVTKVTGGPGSGRAAAR